MPSVLLDRKRIAVVINPISGTGRRPAVARARAELAAGLIRAHGGEADVQITECRGHATALAAQAVERGATVVAAWGGDGTINEVASALAFQDRAALAVVPSGSGNGLARELGVPFTPVAALEVAMTGRECRLDAGELDGRLFFNVAGLGFDALVATRFAECGLDRRGMARYVMLAVRELLTYVPDDYTVIADGVTVQRRAFLVAIANTRQYGNGALIAPLARFDDGRLDVVMVGYRPLWRAWPHVPRLFTGTLHRVDGVHTQSARQVEVRTTRPAVYHVDGEPHAGGAILRACVHPGAVRVRVPRAPNVAVAPR